MLKVWRTSEVAAAGAVNAQTLRITKRRGLLPEPARSPSGYRDYGERRGGVVRFVKARPTTRLHP